MKFLTKSQKQFLSRREIKVGGFYPFPAFGFRIYSEPNHLSGERIDTNPFTKSLANEFFVVKEITDDFYKGNFKSRAKGSDFYMVKEELSNRSGIEKLLLSLLLFIPFFIYNLFKGGVKETDETKPTDEKIVLLGKKNFWWYLQMILVTPFWFFSLSPTKKSWKEFKYGMISHKCDFDYDNPVTEKHNSYLSTHFNCKHYGCNIVSHRDENGNFDFDIGFNKNRATHLKL